jgi:hypothetical protein
VMPYWAVMMAIRGAEPLVERSAVLRRRWLAYPAEPRGSAVVVVGTGFEHGAGKRKGTEQGLVAQAASERFGEGDLHQLAR